MQSVENQIVRKFEKCRPYAKIVPRKNFRNNGKRPFSIANARKRAPGGGPEGPLWQGWSDPKKFFLPKNARFGRKSRMGRFFERKKLPKIYPTTD